MDIFGEIYEYFLGNFALAEGKDGGTFCTPATVVRYMVEVLDLQPGEYFNSYIETYLMRDAVDDYGIIYTEDFRQFLRACAAFTGQLVNYNDLDASAGVSGVTAKEWVKILQSMGSFF